MDWLGVGMVVKNRSSAPKLTPRPGMLLAMPMNNLPANDNSGSDTCWRHIMVACPKVIEPPTIKNPKSTNAGIECREDAKMKSQQ
jgi:hypothetical protein